MHAIKDVGSIDFVDMAGIALTYATSGTSGTTNINVDKTLDGGKSWHKISTLPNGT